LLQCPEASATHTACENTCIEQSDNLALACDAAYDDCVAGMTSESECGRQLIACNALTERADIACRGECAQRFQLDFGNCRLGAVNDLEQTCERREGRSGFVFSACAGLCAKDSALAGHPIERAYLSAVEGCDIRQSSCIEEALIVGSSCGEACGDNPGCIAACADESARSLASCTAGYGVCMTTANVERQKNLRDVHYEAHLCLNECQSRQMILADASRFKRPVCDAQLNQCVGVIEAAAHLQFLLGPAEAALCDAKCGEEESPSAAAQCRQGCVDDAARRVLAEGIARAGAAFVCCIKARGASKLDDCYLACWVAQQNCLRNAVPVTVDEGVRCQESMLACRTKCETNPDIPKTNCRKCFEFAVSFGAPGAGQYIPVPAPWSSFGIAYTSPMP